MNNVITMGKAIDLLLRRKLRGDLGTKKYDRLTKKAQDIQEWVILENYRDTQKEEELV